MTDCQSGTSGWQHPYSIRRLPICSTCRLLHPLCRRSGKKPGSVRCLKYQRQGSMQTTAHLIQQSCPDWRSEPWSTHSSIQRFSTRPLPWHYRINLLSVPQATRQLLSSPYSAPLPTCCNPTHLSLSSPWIFPRHLTPSNTLHCCPRWLLLTCRRQSTTGWWTSSASYRVKWRSFAYKEHHGKYNTGLGRWTSHLHCHSRRSQTAQHRQHIHYICRRHVPSHPCRQSQYWGRWGQQYCSMGSGE